MKNKHVTFIEARTTVFYSAMTGHGAEPYDACAVELLCFLQRSTTLTVAWPTARACMHRLFPWSTCPEFVAAQALPWFGIWVRLL